MPVLDFANTASKIALASSHDFQQTLFQKTDSFLNAVSQTGEKKAFKNNYLSLNYKSAVARDSESA